MKILKFTGQLSDIMGEDASKNWTKECGLKFHNGHQNAEEGITLMEVIDEEKASKYYELVGVEVLNETQADVVVAEKMDKVSYKKYDNELYGANIQSKISKGLLDIDVLLPEWTDQQELECLYNSGISGIKKDDVKVKKFTVTNIDIVKK